MARVDVDDGKDSTAKAWLLSGSDSAFFREWFSTQPSERRLSICKGIIKKKLSQMNCVNDKELDEYIDRVIGTLTEDQLSELEQSPIPMSSKSRTRSRSCCPSTAAMCSTAGWSRTRSSADPTTPCPR